MSAKISALQQRLAKSKAAFDRSYKRASRAFAAMHKHRRAIVRTEQAIAGELDAVAAARAAKRQRGPRTITAA